MWRWLSRARTWVIVITVVTSRIGGSAFTWLWVIVVIISLVIIVVVIIIITVVISLSSIVVVVISVVVIFVYFVIIIVIIGSCWLIRYRVGNVRWGLRCLVTIRTYKERFDRGSNIHIITIILKIYLSLNIIKLL